MGLDTVVRTYISKYSDDNPISDKDYDKYSEDGAFCVFVLTPDWNDRISDCEPDKWYKSIDSRYSLHYPYSWHSRFRQAIADAVYSGNEWHNIKEGPFSEFLDFADNEGVITWTTCGKLYDDFNEWQETFHKCHDGTEAGDWFCKIYDQWMADFAEAHDTKGCIEYR